MDYVSDYGVATTAYMIKNKLAGKDAGKSGEGEGSASAPTAEKTAKPGESADYSELDD